MPAVMLTLNLKYRQAAGALVTDNDGRFLVFKRAGSKGYDLVGGKLEEGEATWQATMREVKEESGLDITILPFKPFTGINDEFQFTVYRAVAYNTELLTGYSEGQAEWVEDISVLLTGMYPEYNRRMLAHFGFVV